MRSSCTCAGLPTPGDDCYVGRGLPGACWHARRIALELTRLVPSRCTASLYPFGASSPVRFCVGGLWAALPLLFGGPLISPALVPVAYLKPLAGLRLLASRLLILTMGCAGRVGRGWRLVARSPGLICSGPDWGSSPSSLPSLSRWPSLVLYLQRTIVRMPCTVVLGQIIGNLGKVGKTGPNQAAEAGGFLDSWVWHTRRTYG